MITKVSVLMDILIFWNYNLFRIYWESESVDETKQIKEELSYIYSSIDNLSNTMNDINNTLLNSKGGLEYVLIIIVLFCINSNIKKLTQAIRENKK